MDKYLRLYLGELTVTEIGINNPSAHAFLIDLLSSLRRLAGRRGDKKASEFVDSFFYYRYAGGQDEREISNNIEFDPIGASLGIIYTTVNLGEGE